MTETFVCAKCNQNVAEENYEIALCPSCRSEFVNRPFPIWIKLAMGGVLVIFLLACNGIPSSLSARLAFERGQKAEHDGNYALAISEYKKAEQYYPDSTKILVRETIACFKGNDLNRAAAAAKKIQGRKIDKAAANEVNRVIEQIAKKKTSL